MRCNPCFIAEGILCRHKIGKLWHFWDFTKRFLIKMWGLVSWLKVDEIYKFTSFKCSQGNIYVQKLHFLSSSLLQKRSVTLDTFARSDSELWIDSLPRLLYNLIMTYNDTVTCNSVIANGSINFTYDCWEMFRLAPSRPLGERSEPCLAAKRPTASDDVKSDEELLESLIRPSKPLKDERRGHKNNLMG